MQRSHCKGKKWDSLPTVGRLSGLPATHGLPTTHGFTSDAFTKKVRRSLKQPIGQMGKSPSFTRNSTVLYISVSNAHQHVLYLGTTGHDLASGASCSFARQVAQAT